MENDELVVINKLQRLIKELYQNIGETMISGGVDNMEKYRYMLGQAHALQLILQEISNLLNPKKEQKNEQDNTNIIQFGDYSDS
jgi:hypothetical protein